MVEVASKSPDLNPKPTSSREIRQNQRVKASGGKGTGGTVENPEEPV